MLNYLTAGELLDLSQSISSPIFKKTKYPWESLEQIGKFISEIGPTLSPTEYIQTKEKIWISKQADVAESSSISGPCIIGKNAQVRHCAFIRGNVIVGQNSVIGNSTEVKNSILFNGVQVPHYNYIGDSIIGYKSHMGAGAITSNVRSDKNEVDIAADNRRIHTGLKKLGAIIGDFCEIGCNAVLNPGTILGRNASIYPLSMVRGYIWENSIFKNNGKIVMKN